MFKNKPTTKAELEKLIAITSADIEQYTPGTPEHTASVDTLIKLVELKAQKARKPTSPDVLLTVAGNLLGILIIVGYERMNIVTSKALPFVMKPR